MTSSRVVRGSKGRILLGIFVIVSITVIIACFNNVLSQLSDTKKNYEQCHQQQENLSTQLQVIFDYKQRLEKSLKTEKVEHQQSKHDLETKLDEERKHHEKSINEINIKFSSLQQHYNLLQTEYDDYKEESSKIQRQQLSEVNDLQSKLKEIQGQHKQSMNEKDKTFEHLKSKFLQLQDEKDNLAKQVLNTNEGTRQSQSDMNHLIKENHELQREIEELKTKLAAPKNEISDNIEKPKNEGYGEVIENKNENNQLGVENTNDNVLPIPKEPALQQSKSSTTSSNVVSKPSLEAQPLHSPSISGSLVKNNSLSNGQIIDAGPVLPLPYNPRKLPQGVPPILDTNQEDKAHKADADDKEIRDDVNNALPNRYRSNIILNELAKENKIIEGDKLEKKLDAADKENNALEVFDSPNNIGGFGIDDGRVEVKRSQKDHKQIHVEGVKSNDALGRKVYDGQENAEYDKEVPNDMQLEEEAEDGTH
ncbi:hypothetical protein FQR65_LT12639 [Abscondita terminalis]|nr:hypothetical protein FQR65_LT12639 [Abscondita terminalis]